MKSLNQNWFIENLVDFEYKRYILLAYLKEVQDNFHENRLYPFMSELVSHYRNLTAFKENKNTLYNSFPEKISEIDLEKFQIAYDKVIKDDALMSEIEEIVNFSIPKIKYHLNEGKDIYDFIESNMSISPVGILPLYRQEGYLMINDNAESNTKVWEYQITFFEQKDETFRGIHTNFQGAYKNTLVNTYENIKKDLISQNQKLPNPATYVVETDLGFPMDETVLPIARRLLVKYISKT